MSTVGLESDSLVSPQVPGRYLRAHKHRVVVTWNEVDDHLCKHLVILKSKMSVVATSSSTVSVYQHSYTNARYQLLLAPMQLWEPLIILCCL